MATAVAASPADVAPVAAAPAGTAAPTAAVRAPAAPALRAAGNTKTKIVTLDLSEPIALDMVKGGNVVAIVADQAYELGRAMAEAAGYGLVDKAAPLASSTRM